jgi:hypothetical protein
MKPRKPVMLLLSTGFVILFAVLLLRGGWVQASAPAGAPAQVPAIQGGPDQDGDGLPDAWETAHGLNPRIGSGINGAAGDPDRDGLPNGDEWANSTDPQRADTDGDGLSDLWEVENVVDPLVADGANGPDGDPDEDGLLNRDEMVRGTDPHNWDSDGDILPDGYEVIKGISPKDNRGNNGANGRRNGNAETNLAEFERLNDDYSPPMPPRSGR